MPEISRDGENNSVHRKTTRRNKTQISLSLRRPKMTIIIRPSAIRHSLYSTVACQRGSVLRALGFVWGISGVILLLAFAIYRLAPIAIEVRTMQLTLFQWGVLVFSVLYMAYAEGYKGFHRAFSPRVVQRANYLRDNPRWQHVLLAPAFCMGFIYATRRRQILSIGLTLVIVAFVLIAKQLPQPWRSILDAGVVTGLSLGILSIVYFLVNSLREPGFIRVPPEVPDDSSSQRKPVTSNA